MPPKKAPGRKSGEKLSDVRIFSGLSGLQTLGEHLEEASKVYTASPAPPPRKGVPDRSKSRLESSLARTALLPAARKGIVARSRKLPASGAAPSAPIKEPVAPSVSDIARGTIEVVSSGRPASVAEPRERGSEAGSSAALPSLDSLPGVPLEDLSATGMVPKDAEVVRDFSRANEVMMVWRPINPAAAKLLSTAHPFPHKGKYLNIKAKSSEFAPIAAEIPRCVILSKAGYGLTAAVVMRQQAKLDEELDRGREKLADWERAGKSPEQINDELFVAAVDKQCEGCTLQYMTDDNGSLILHPGTRQPVFVIIKSGELYYYRDDTQQFVPMAESSLAQGELHPVQVLAYVQVTRGADGAYHHQYFPITADYDELTSAPLSVFPLAYNEIIKLPTALLKLEDLVTLSKDRNTEDAHERRRESFARAVAAYEIDQQAQYRVMRDYSDAYKLMGLANEEEWVIKTALREDTQGATNHGRDVDSPWPQPLTDGNYVVHIPDGRTKCLRNEREICDFVNQAREYGYRLPVHPRWGWEVDEGGRLCIPAHRFNWSKVKTDLENLHEQLVRLERETRESVVDLQARRNISCTATGFADEARECLRVMLARRNIPYNEATFASLRAGKYTELVDLPSLAEEGDERWLDDVALLFRACDLCARSRSEESLVELQTEIERLKLEPPVVYGRPTSEAYQELVRELPAFAEVSPQELELIQRRVRELVAEDCRAKVVELRRELECGSEQHARWWGRGPSIVARVAAEKKAADETSVPTRVVSDGVAPS